MKSQAIHATKPESRRPPVWATALARPMVAMLPLSRYLNGAGGPASPLSRFAMRAETYSPCCMATGARPGSALPSGVLKLARSPSTKMSGRLPTVQSEFTWTRPARSVSTPPTAWASSLPSPDAFTPAAHTMVSVSIVVASAETESSFTRT